MADIPAAAQAAALDQADKGAPVPLAPPTTPKIEKTSIQTQKPPSQQQPAPQATDGAPVPEEEGAPTPEEEGAPVPESGNGEEPTPIQMSGIDKKDPRGPGFTPATDWISQNLKAYHGEGDLQAARDATNPHLSFVDQCKAALGLSWKNSDIGLMTNGLPPPLPPNLTKMARVCAFAGEMAGDIPSFIMGGAIGEATAPESKIPIIGPVLGAGHASGTANALHMGIRKALIDGYESGDFKSPSDAAERLAGMAWDMTKGYAAGLGGAAAGKAIEGGSKLLKTATEAYTMTAIASALEGHMPSREDMYNAAIGVAGIHAAQTILPKIHETYVNTGEKPADIAYRLKQDPALLEKFLNNIPGEPPEATPTNFDPDTKAPIPISGDMKLPEEAAPNTGKPLQAIAEIPPEPKPLVPKEGEPLPGSADALGLSDSAKKMLSYIGDKTEEIKTAGLGETWQETKTKLDEIYTERLARDRAPAIIYEKAGIPRAPDDAAALMQKFSAIGDVVDQFIGGKGLGNQTYGGTRDWYTGKVNGESFEHIKDEYRSEFPDDRSMLKLKAVGVAARILEKSSKLTEEGKQKYKLTVDGETMSVEDAKKVVADHPEVQQYLDRFVAWKQRGLKYMHDAGFWTEKQYNAILDENKAHMSFKRVQEMDVLTESKGGKGKTIKRFGGEGGLLQDPIASGIMDMDMMIRSAHANEVATKFLTDMQKAGHPEDFIRLVKAEQKPIEVSAKEIERHFDKQGEEINPDAAEGLTIFRPNYQMLTKGQFRVQIGGKPHVIETTPLMADAINSLTAHPEAMALWAKTLAPFARTLTKATMWLPGFAARHIFKNERNAQIFSQTELTSFYDVLMNVPKMFDVEGFKEAYDKHAPVKEIVSKLLSPSQAWQDARVGQTFTSGIGLAGEDYVQNQLYDIDPNVSFGRKAWNQVKNTAESIVGFSHYGIVAADNAVRFTERQRVLERGGSEIAANYAGRQVVPDYQRSGIQRNALTGLCSFLQAHFASNAQLIEMVRKDPGGVVARSLLQYTATSLLIYAASQNDDRVDDQKRVMNDNYMLYPTDNWRPATQALASATSYADPGLARQMQDGTFQINDGPLVRIPRSWTLDTLFGMGPIAAMQSLKQKDPAAIKQWAKDVGKSFIPNLIPEAIKVPEQILTNHNEFMDGPLVSPATEKLLPLYQSAPWTTESAKQIAKLVHNVPGLRDFGTGPSRLENPQVIDSIIRGFGGATGDYITSMVDAGLQKAGVKNVALKPAWEITQYPIIKEFFLQVPSASTQPIEDFYKNVKKTKETFATERFYMRPDKGNSIETANEVHNLYGEFEYNMGGYEKTMHNLNAQIQGVVRNTSYSASDKSQLIEPLLFMMMGTAKHGNEALKAFQKSRQDMLH